MPRRVKQSQKKSSYSLIDGEAISHNILKADFVGIDDSSDLLCGDNICSAVILSGAASFENLIVSNSVTVSIGTKFLFIRFFFAGEDRLLRCSVASSELELVLWSKIKIRSLWYPAHPRFDLTHVVQ